MNLQIFQIAAFTSKPFGGNPAAVVPLSEWLPDETMSKVAAENNLSETAFFVKEGDAYHIRWFTPTIEINLCGHETLASSHVIFNELKSEDHSIRFHSDRSGRLGVEKEGDNSFWIFRAIRSMRSSKVPSLQTPWAKSRLKCGKRRAIW